MTSREHPAATITTPVSTPGQSGCFESESVAAFVRIRSCIGERLLHIGSFGTHIGSFGTHIGDCSTCYFGEQLQHYAQNHHGNHQRHLNRRNTFKQSRAAALAEWRQLAA